MLEASETRAHDISGACVKCHGVMNQPSVDSSWGAPFRFKVKSNKKMRISVPNRIDKVLVAPSERIITNLKIARHNEKKVVMK